MNLFDVISGNRKLQEEHVTAVLAWLLDPGQSHGCGSLFLKRLLAEIDAAQFDVYLDGIRDTVDLRQQGATTAHVLMEHAVTTRTGKKRQIDIVIHNYRLRQN